MVLLPPESVVVAVAEQRSQKRPLLLFRGGCAWWYLYRELGVACEFARREGKKSPKRDE